MSGPRPASWELGRLPETHGVIIDLHFPAEAQSMIVVNPLRLPIYVTFRQSPDPTALEFDVVCPPRSMLTVPVIGRGIEAGAKSFIGRAAIFSPTGSQPPLTAWYWAFSTDGGLLATSAAIFGSELVLPPSVSPIGASTDELLAAVSAGPAYNQASRSSALFFDNTVGGVTILKSGASNLENRKFISVQNLGPGDLYVGDANITGAAGSGTKVVPGALYGENLGPDVNLYGITDDAAGVELRIEERA